MRSLLLSLLALTCAACASAPAPDPSAELWPDGLFSGTWNPADAPQQEGRIAMSVTCHDACTLGARLLAGEGKTLWVSLSGEDYGSVYLQEIDAQGVPTAQRVLFTSTAASPFPSPDPVFIEIALKNGELTGWAGDARIWGFGRQIEAELPAIGEWAVYHDDAPPVGFVTHFDNVTRVIGTVVFENSQARPRANYTTGDGFTARAISDLFYSETVSAADVNRDGITDIITGGLYYLGPTYDVAREIFTITAVAPESYSTGLVSATDDFNGDGWVDLLTIESGTPAGHPALIFLNPQGQSRHWDRFVILEHTQVEAIAYDDVDGDGKGELVVIVDGQIGLARPNADPRAPWSFTAISEKRERWSAHGIGVGDIDGDGRKDVLHGSGWFRQPATAGEPWVYTPVAFGFGAQLHVEDFNGDGRNDVVGTVDAHGWGLAWHEQTASGAFERHLIMGNPAQTPPSDALTAFSQPHALFVTDINGDGLSDIITGKRWWAHRDTYRDPDGHGRAVLYAFLQQRDGNAVTFAPHYVGDHIGVGNQIAVTDLSGDGRPEIISSARRGTVIYMNGLE